MGADDAAPVWDTCGNPLLPSMQIGCFIAITWVMTYAVSPIVKDRREKTWSDVMLLHMNKLEGAQFSLFCVTATVVCMLFASINEDGEEVTPFLAYLLVFWVIFFVFLLSVVFFDATIRPLIYPITSQLGAEESIQSAPNADTFVLGGVVNPAMGL